MRMYLLIQFILQLPAMIINQNNRTLSPQRRVMPISQAKLLSNQQNRVEFHYGRTQQPLAKVGSPVQTFPSRQSLPSKPGSSFLTYPIQISQQQIPLSSLGLRKVVEGPTVKWPSTRKSFLGSVVTGQSLGTGISSDPDFIAKGFGLHKSPTIVYCPVCEKSYPPSSPVSLQQHILYHRQLDQIQNNQIIEQSKTTHRQTTKLSQAGLSDQTIHAPLIIEPEEFVIQDKSPAINNLFVVNSGFTAPEEQPLVRNIENTPLQYPIERSNGYSCLDGWVNRDHQFGCTDVCTKNQVIARPRLLTEWEVDKKTHRIS